VFGFFMPGLVKYGIISAKLGISGQGFLSGGFSWFGKGGARVREVEWSPSRQRGFSWLGKRGIGATRVEQCASL